VIVAWFPRDAASLIRAHRSGRAAHSCAGNRRSRL